MVRALARIAAAAAWTALALLAAAGLVLSGLAANAALFPSGPVVRAIVRREVAALVPARVTFEGLAPIPRGGFEVRGLELRDPDGHVVLAAPRARVFLDVTRLAHRRIGLTVEVDSPTVVVATEQDGSLSIVRAFTPEEAAPEAPAAGGHGAEGPFTLRLDRLEARGATVRWLGRDGRTVAEATAIDLDGEGWWSGDDAALALRARGAAALPVEGPLAVSAAATLRGSRLEVPALDVAVGENALEAAGWLDVRTLAFRAAVRRLGIAAADARRLVPPAGAPGSDLAATAYGESDGRVLDAALDVRTAGGAGAPGSARVAVALHPARPGALGLDVALTAFDPARLLARAPPGRLDLTAHGALAGRGLSDGRARISLALARSSLRGAEVGPIALEARADRGLVEVLRLEARLPGLSLEAHGSWREHGEAAGAVDVDAGDLAAAGRALAALARVKVPPLSGRLRAHAAVSGQADAPSVEARVETALAGAGGVRAEDVFLSLSGAGNLETGRVRIAGHAARVRAGDGEARAVELAASIVDDEASLSLTGTLPAVGPDPVALEGKARLAADRRRADVRALSLRWPGARFALVRPAAVAFAPLSVDRVELADGPRAIALAGGLGEDGALDLRLEVRRLDLAALPHGLLPAEAGLAGVLTIDARATGAVHSPAVKAHVEVADGAVRGAGGLSLRGDGGWDGAGRLAAGLDLARADGGAARLSLDLPLPLAGAPAGEAIALTLEATAWPLDLVRRAAGTATPLPGTVRGRVTLSGTAAAPRLEAALAVADAALGGLSPLAGEAALLDEGGVLRASAETRLGEEPLVSVEASVPLSVVALLRDPEGTIRAVRRAPLEGKVVVAGLDLARVSGKAGLPAGLAGTLSGEAALSGTAAAPRGRATLSLRDGAAAGYRELEAEAELELGAERTRAAVRVSLSGAEALRADGSLGAPPERLADPARLREAPLALEVVVPSLALARRAEAALPVEGTVSAKLSARGTPARPEGRLELEATSLKLRGRPVGDLRVRLRQEGPKTAGEVALRSAAGGTLRADGTVETPRGWDDPRALREAETDVRIGSDRLDLGFLPALLPGVVRAAAGRLTVDLAARGPLAKLRPKGKVTLEDGRLDVVEVGDWSGIALAATLGDGSVEVSRLEARRRGGRVSGTLLLADLGTETVRFEGKLALAQAPISYGGSDLATLDLPVELEGTLGETLLDAKVTVAGGTIKLPRRASGELQPLADRPDIVEADLVAERARRRKEASAEAGAPFEVRVRVVASKLVVRAERPALNVELGTDSTWRVTGSDVQATGTIETVRGTVEPIAARVFHLERGKVSFPGGPVKAGALDIVARYDNPVAVVTVTIRGTVAKPVLAFSSQPPLDDARIAMLIATGRTEMNLNTNSVAPLTTQEASAAVIGAAMSAVFSGLVSDKLPVDQISFDTSRLYAGKYVTDSLFVGYAYRFEAKPEEKENVNEVRAEYRLARRWRFELRYGDANVGDASIIWTTDY